MSFPSVKSVVRKTFEKKRVSWLLQSDYYGRNFGTETKKEAFRPLIALGGDILALAICVAAFRVVC